MLVDRDDVVSVSTPRSLSQPSGAGGEGQVRARTNVQHNYLDHTQQRGKEYNRSRGEGNTGREEAVTMMVPRL